MPESKQQIIATCDNLWPIEFFLYVKKGGLQTGAASDLIQNIRYNKSFK